MGSPFFYFNNRKILFCVKRYSSRNFLLNYSAKACLFKGLIKFFNPLIDGFSVSSIDELKKTKLETNKPIHFVSPLIRKTEIDVINSLANSIAFNSLEQFDRFKELLQPHIKIFLRVNPEVSIIGDKRYDPCRKYSKLGIPLKNLKKYLSNFNNHSITGLHFHTACQETNILNMVKTLDKIKNDLGILFHTFKSINIGGGYVYTKKSFDKLQELNKEYKQNFIIEPGFDLINSSGYLVSSVTDIFERAGKKIAILNTSVNHLPEVFEYNFSPEVAGAEQKKGYSYILAGASCLAGDIFGEYSMKQHLDIGSYIIFKNIGAYSLVKAHRFNGLEIPKVLSGNQSIEDVVHTLDKNNNSTSFITCEA
ncbi:MAG: hypothetical protein OXK80_00460 [Bdellovibrionales bacterium]|nr:hypothetical protein [Bdellovibrionales bacterium]